MSTIVLAPHGMNPTLPVGITSSNDFSMKSRLLPFLEQSNVWNSLNQSYDFNTVVHPTAGGTTIQTFLCPSDSNKVARDREFLQRRRLRRYELLQ